MKLEAGMKVLVRPDLKAGHTYDGKPKKRTHSCTIATSEMTMLKGKIATIYRVDNVIGLSHKIKEDLHYYNWSTSMFLPINEETLFESLVKGEISSEDYNNAIKHIK